MATAAERTAAQRRIAREIHSGTYKPSKIGAKARQVARDLLPRTRDLAYYNINRRLSDYYKYNDATVRANVYGGTTAESGAVPGMDIELARFFADADTETLRAFAADQRPKNPGFYH